MPSTVELLAVDDVDLAGQFGRHPQFLAVGRRRETARPRAHHHVLHHIAAVGIDEMDEIADLGGDVDEMAVLADEHALGLGAGRHLLDDDVLVHVDDRERGALLVRHVDAPPLLVDAEGLRARPGRELADHLELGDVDDVDHVVVAAGDIELGVVGAEMHVARPPRRLEILDDLVGLGIDDDEVVGLLVAHEDEPGVLGERRRRHGRRRTGRQHTPAMQNGADNRRRVGTGGPLLLAKAIAPSVRLIQAAGQAARPPPFPRLAEESVRVPPAMQSRPRIGRVLG